MSLRLIDRVGALLRADAHGVVDALEERSLLLRQHLREAELEIASKRARLEAFEEEEERLAERAARLADEIRALDEDVELALGGGKDDLARFAAGRLLARRREQADLERRLAEGRAAAEKLRQRLAEQEERFDALRSRVRAHRASPETTRVGATPDPPVTEEEIELELLRRRRAEGSR